MRILARWSLVGFWLCMVGCTVKISPPLSSSLGMSAFDAMRVIQPRDVAIALYIDPKIREIQGAQKIKSGEFSFPVGAAFSVKLVKALAYHFDTIVLIDQPAYSGDVPIHGLMRVTLQDVDLNMSVKSGFATVQSESYTRLVVRAELQDYAENRPVWVGTTQAQESSIHQEMSQLTYQEAGRGFASGIDVAIDKAVGDLVGQIQKSSNLKASLDRWEGKPGAPGAAPTAVKAAQ